jgi:hypothetical protein
MAAVMRVACVTREFDWALGVVERFWKDFEQSPLHKSAYFKYQLHSGRARMLLNRHVLVGERGDPERTVHHDVEWLSTKSPAPLRAAVRARLSARIAQLRGDRARAAEQFRVSVAQHQQLGAADDVERERYALGCVLGGDDGKSLKALALAALHALGIAEPLADMRSYYPEFFREM